MKRLFMDPWNGADDNPGTEESPLQTFTGVRKYLESRWIPVNVHLLIMGDVPPSDPYPMMALRALGVTAIEGYRLKAHVTFTQEELSALEVERVRLGKKKRAPEPRKARR